MQAFPVFNDEFSWRLTQTLLHFLWQGSVIGLAALVLDGMLRRVSSFTPYSLHLSALLLMAACPPVTFALVGGSDSLRNAVGPQARDAHRSNATVNLSAPYSSEAELSQPHRASGGEDSTLSAGQVDERPL